ncbi:MAG: Rpn family recombination-promoting nuclease/putative transposase [Lachnospiraceae bacterium]|nr:Rpn family recombination-promoting nuclease/putative transposase [Lachnospiraceae bacterium]
MGRKNNVMCEYLARPDVFADFLNAGYFRGEKKILPEELTDCSQVSYDKDSGAKSGERSRDVVKARCKGTRYAIIGIENQELVHYAMPFRCMEYDVREYRKQLRILRQRNSKEENRRLSSEEFVSGLSRTDKLKPVVTIVFYHGTKKYDGCKNLHDMLDLEGENKIFSPYVADYKMNLICPDDINEETCETGLRDLIGFLKCREDKKAIQEYCKCNAERIKMMDEDTFDTITEMINSKELLKNKEKYREGERGTINMCKAMEDWAEDLRTEGKAEGKAEGKTEGLLEGVKAVIEICKELGATQEEVLLKISEKFLFSKQEAGMYVEKYWHQ